MRRRWVSLVIGSLAALTFYGGGQLGVAPSRAQTITAAHAALPQKLIIYKRFGAALRKSPSSNARIVRVLPCGQDLAVVKANQGWYYVDVGPYEGWVGGARVADENNPPAYDCTDAYTFQMHQRAYSYVRTGCLSLRVTPSRNAVYHYCVANYHNYVVTNGPIEVAGEDWFQVTSPSTGAGWSLAVYLLPYQR
jgi:hypothetical protein